MNTSWHDLKKLRNKDTDVWLRRHSESRYPQMQESWNSSELSHECLTNQNIRVHHKLMQFHKRPQNKI